MKFVFLTSLSGGLLLGVRVMLYGVERPRVFGDFTAPTFRVSPAVLAVVAVVFGTVGYMVLRTNAPWSEATVIASASAVLLGALTAWLVKRWWSAPVEHDVDDPRYVLQGHIACVVTSIEKGRDGEVAFEVGNSKRIVRARSIDDGALATGTEVVIERLEDDLAYVESWVQVEKRL